MLVGADDGGIDNDVFEIRIISQRFEKALPDTGSAPAVEPTPDRVPGTKVGWKIAPGTTGSGHVKHRLDEVPIVRSVPATIARLTWDPRSKARPLAIG